MSMAFTLNREASWKRLKPEVEAVLNEAEKCRNEMQRLLKALKQERNKKSRDHLPKEPDAKDKEIRTLIKALEKELHSSNLQKELNKKEQEIANLKNELGQVKQETERLISYTRSLQDREEKWNREEGKLFDSLARRFQALCGFCDKGDQKGVDSVLADLRGKVQGYFGYPREPLGFPKKAAKASLSKDIKVKDIKNEVLAIRQWEEKNGHSLFYRHLTLPLVCLLASADFRDPASGWKANFAKILGSERIHPLYQRELGENDAKNKALFIEADGGMDTPGLFLEKEDGSRSLLGSFQGQTKRAVENDGRS